MTTLGYNRPVHRAPPTHRGRFDLRRFRSGWSGWPSGLALLGLGLGLVYLWIYLARPGGNQGARWLSDFGQTPIEGIAVFLTLTVVWRERRAGDRIAWLFIALALAANLLGNLIYGGYDLAGAPSFPSIADGFYLAFYPLIFFGLLWLLTPNWRAEMVNWRTWTNIFIVILGGAIALIHFVLMPVLIQSRADGLAGGILLAYPTGDLALLAALATMTGRRVFPSDRGAFWFFFLAVGAWFFADLAFAAASSIGAYTPGDPSNLIRLLGDGAFLLAAHSRLSIAARLRVEAAQSRRALAIGRVSPYAMLGVGLITLIIAALGDTGELVLLVLLTVGLTAIVVTRQIIDDHERRVAQAALLIEKTIAAETAERQARIDSLTDLPNRTGLGELLRTEMAVAARIRAPLTLAFLDLNFFKAINDNFGHAAGDQVLIEVGRRLTTCLRAGDTATRLGGDEFALVLPGASADQAIEVANRIRGDLERPFFVMNNEVNISAAIGLATYPNSGARDEDSLIRQADTAMYRAKKRHLGPTSYDATCEQEVSDSVALRECLTGDGLILLFQPIQEPRGHIRAAEALVRWMHPIRGLLGAPDIIALATQSGLIGQLDRRILDLACAQAQAWLAGGLSLRVSVNISSDSLADHKFVDCVRQTLATHQLPSSALELEITEDGLADNPAQAGWFVQQMHELGVGMSIDDFGIGHSSLARLRDLPVQALKIDRSFVLGALTEPADAAIIESVIGLGHHLGLAVAAVGVEDSATLAYLEACGVDLTQGHLVGRPMTPETLFDLLIRDRQTATAKATAGETAPGLTDTRT